MIWKTGKDSCEEVKFTDLQYKQDVSLVWNDDINGDQTTCSKFKSLILRCKVETSFRWFWRKLGTSFGNLPNEEAIIFLEVSCSLLPWYSSVDKWREMHLETSVLFIFEPCRIANCSWKVLALPSIRKATAKTLCSSTGSVSDSLWKVDSQSKAVSDIFAGWQPKDSGLEHQIQMCLETMLC